MVTECSRHFESAIAKTDGSWVAVSVNTRGRIRCRTQVSIQQRGDLLPSVPQAPKEKEGKAWVTKALPSLVPRAGAHVIDCL